MTVITLTHKEAYNKLYIPLLLGTSLAFLLCLRACPRVGEDDLKTHGKSKKELAVSVHTREEEKPFSLKKLSNKQENHPFRVSEEPPTLEMTADAGESSQRHALISPWHGPSYKATPAAASHQRYAQEGAAGIQSHPSVQVNDFPVVQDNSIETTVSLKSDSQGHPIFEKSIPLFKTDESYIDNDTEKKPFPTIPSKIKAAAEGAKDVFPFERKDEDPDASAGAVAVFLASDSGHVSDASEGPILMKDVNTEIPNLFSIQQNERTQSVLTFSAPQEGMGLLNEDEPHESLVNQPIPLDPFLGLESLEKAEAQNVPDVEEFEQPAQQAIPVYTPLNPPPERAEEKSELLAVTQGTFDDAQPTNLLEPSNGPAVNLQQVSFEEGQGKLTEDESLAGPLTLRPLPLPSNEVITVPLDEHLGSLSDDEGHGPLRILSSPFAPLEALPQVLSPIPESPERVAFERQQGLLSDESPSSALLFSGNPQPFIDTLLRMTPSALEPVQDHILSPARDEEPSALSLHQPLRDLIESFLSLFPSLKAESTRIFAHFSPEGITIVVSDEEGNTQTTLLDPSQGLGRALADVFSIMNPQELQRRVQQVLPLHGMMEDDSLSSLRELLPHSFFSDFMRNLITVSHPLQGAIEFLVPRLQAIGYSPLLSSPSAVIEEVGKEEPQMSSVSQDLFSSGRETLLEAAEKVTDALRELTKAAKEAEVFHALRVAAQRVQNSLINLKVAAQEAREEKPEDSQKIKTLVKTMKKQVRETLMGSLRDKFPAETIRNAVGNGKPTVETLMQLFEDFVEEKSPSDSPQMPAQRSSLALSENEADVLLRGLSLVEPVQEEPLVPVQSKPFQSLEVPQDLIDRYVDDLARHLSLRFKVQKWKADNERARNTFPTRCAHLPLRGGYVFDEDRRSELSAY